MSQPRDQARCGCDAWRKAEREGFVRATESGAFLADREQGVRGATGWSSLFGPSIAHCPFCGLALRVRPIQLWDRIPASHRQPWCELERILDDLHGGKDISLESANGVVARVGWGTNCDGSAQLHFAATSTLLALRPQWAPVLLRYPMKALYAGGVTDEGLIPWIEAYLGRDDRYVFLPREGEEYLRGLLVSGRSVLESTFQAVKRDNPE